MPDSFPHTPALTPTEVEILNSHGPYDHAKWTGRGVSITSEGALTGRAELLAQLVRQAIIARYGVAEMRSKSIIDVGCYDGFVLHALSDLPFRTLVGYEPRLKNILKGNAVREILGISSRCDFRLGSLDDIAQTFDIVICTGLLHHLSSPLAGIRKLRSICKDFLFLETIILPEDLLPSALRVHMELKDLPYLSGESFVGFSGHKLESDYSDGSATAYSVVSVPSTLTLNKYLDLAGFGNLALPITVNDYTALVRHGAERTFSATCVTAETKTIVDDGSTIDEWIANYEFGMLLTNLPQDVVVNLYETTTMGQSKVLRPSLATILLDYIHSSCPSGSLALIRRHTTGLFAYELCKNLKFNFRDKLSLEFAKALLAEGNVEQAVPILKSITQGVNADWRAAYRACALLAAINHVAGDRPEHKRYLDLCLCANPKFPIHVVDVIIGNLHKL